MSKYFLVLLACVFALTALQALPPLPSCYHTYAEITAELQQLEMQYPSLAKVYIIGHSQQDNLPIYAIKLSDNVEQEENEPAVLFIGQVHAEEVLGVETTMSNLHEILEHSQNSPYGNWLNQLEMWFIPTINPEGHTVVTDYLDPSYRKNKHDNNNNGVFDFSTLVGYDIDGVDINRNFPFNWVHGDTLFTPPGLDTEAYDYYRGPAAGSESETQALMNFCRQQKPVFCIVWHSSRNPQTGLCEGVFYPLNWYGTRPCPDLALGQQIGEGVAAAIIRENGGGGYEPSASSGRKGDINNWMYKELGTICLVIECGTNNIQPDSTLMVNTVQRCTNGVKWLLNRALPISSAVPSNSMLRGTVTDAVTGQPLEAEIYVEERHAPWFTPRKSDPVNGTYWRPISNGYYHIHFRKKGYAEQVVNGWNVFNSWSTLSAALQPLPAVNLHIAVRNSENGSLLPSQVVLYDVENDTLQTDGEFNLITYQGRHRIEISADGFYPYLDTLEVAAGISSLNLNIILTPAAVHFEENFDNGLANWVQNGTWITENQLAVNGSALTDSWGGKGFYSQNCNTWIRTANPISIPSSGNPLLLFDEHLYTEFNYDLVKVEVSSDTLNWQAIYVNSGQYDWWHPVYVPLNGFEGQSLFLRFHLTDQSNNIDLTDPGWTIDNLRIVTGSATPASDETSGQIPLTILLQTYPNPFHDCTTIKFTTGTETTLKIEIYNIKGQKVKTLTNQLYKRGNYSLSWDGTDDKGSALASGVYFCRLTCRQKVMTEKLLLLK
ncbi:MAG: M14 family zinc carboxypeptidase [Candidatus Cloacimonadaceae bacterium]